MKPAQSMGINLVIITAIALLVLIIIAIVVMGGGSDLREGLDRCSVQGGQCLPQNHEDATFENEMEGSCEQENYACYRVI